MTAGVSLAVHGAGEGPHGRGWFVRLGGGVDVDGLGEDVWLQVGPEEVLSVDAPGQDGGDGDGGANSAVGSDRGGGDIVVLVPFSVTRDAEASASGRLAVAAVRLVRAAPQEVEDLGVPWDGGGGDGGLAVERVEDGDLEALRSVPAGVVVGVGVRVRSEEGAAAGAGVAPGGGGGWERETKGFVRASWEEKILPSRRT